MKKQKKENFIFSYANNINFFFYIYLCIYTLLGLLTLTIFPRVHSDETWLGSLSYAMMKSKSLFTTEPFFDLFPRTPHTMKILFHSLQQLPIRFLGLSIYNIRLVSLFFGLLILILLFKLLSHLFKYQLSALFITILTSLSLPFIYASHFARQEIILVFILIFCYYLYIKEYKYNSLLIPFIIGISISFHPNAFIIACMIGLVLLKDYIIKKVKPLTIITYIGILSLCALGNIVISLIQNPNFITDYINYGSTLSVTAPPASRLMNFNDFYLKLYYQISGTYYIPPMKVLMIATGLFMIIALVIIVIRRIGNIIDTSIYDTSIINSLLMLIAFNIGIFIIGRYNTTSIVFALIPSILLISSIFGLFLQQISIKKNTFVFATISVLIVILTYSSYTEINSLKHINYSKYEEEIASAISNDSIVLGNLSSSFVFKDIVFKDIRNLDYLEEESVYNYLVNNKINTIVYYEEYDYIHRNQNWEILYGDDELYYDDLNQLILDYGTVIHEFENMDYGTRIIRYMGEYPWKVTIYQLDL